MPLIIPHLNLWRETYAKHFIGEGALHVPIMTYNWGTGVMGRQNGTKNGGHGRAASAGLRWQLGSPLVCLTWGRHAESKGYQWAHQIHSPWNMMKPEKYNILFTLRDLLVLLDAHELTKQITNNFYYIIYIYFIYSIYFICPRPSGSFWQKFARWFLQRRAVLGVPAWWPQREPADAATRKVESANPPFYAQPGICSKGFG